MILSKTEINNFQKAIAKKNDSSEKLADLFDAFGDRNRIKILKLFCNKCDMCVSDVAKILDISVSAASQQLKILEVRGIVKKQKKGQLCCYKINESDGIVKSLVKLIQ